MSSITFEGVQLLVMHGFQLCYAAPTSYTHYRHAYGCLSH